MLIGDAQSPHLLKWARALAPRVELYVASSRGFDAGFDALVSADRRLALNAEVQHRGGNVATLRRLPELARWLKRIDADWLHPHYLTSHGTLARAAKLGWRLRGRIVGSAWGSDILVTPQQGALWRELTRWVLRGCALSTSDSMHMAAQMGRLGAAEVLVFPFGLEALPPPPPAKQPWLFFANRGLEPIYAPERVLDVFAAIAQQQPAARLVVANDGSLRAALQVRAAAIGLGDRVRFVGRLDAVAQAREYARAAGYLSLPVSDSVSVSVLEAMAHGCVPLLSDLPANRELVESGRNGLILAGLPQPGELTALMARADAIGRDNRTWVHQHGLFEPAVERLLLRLAQLMAQR